jgi:RNA polymerase sigma-70 factor (ECF subfamily)
MSTPHTGSFKAIYEEYKNLVFNLALHYVQHSEDARDVTQEVFVKIHQHLHKYDSSTASLKTWIYRITINQCLDFLKSKRTKKRFGFISSLFNIAESEEPARFDHPGIALEDKEELKALFAAINKLSPNQRTALILSKIEERPQREIADIMNLGIKAVESLIQRAKTNLSKILNDKEGF